MIKVYIEKEALPVKPELSYLLKVWANAQHTDVTFVDNKDDAVTIGMSDDSTVQLSHGFDFSHQPPLGNPGFITGDNDKPDYLATAFYMLNGVQEWNDNDRDELGRFKYANSYQFTWKNAKDNIVQRCFDEISKAIGLTPHSEKTHFFLTHDIDLVHGAIIEDGFNVLKKGRVDLFLKMLFNVAIGRPDWLNMDQIMKLESACDCRSVFFWIVNKGKINKREKNADYTFSSAAIQRHFNATANNGFENGLHKSISDESFEQEFVKFGRKPFSNRYHYLKFNLPRAYYDIEDAGLQLDASLGFAEEPGFRNSYGRPFNPYNPQSQRPFSFVEVPLHIMDRTYFQYKKYDVAAAHKDIFDFFERNKTNAVISILWHNNFFTNYKFRGYLSLYKAILAYIRDGGFGTISQRDIVKRYSIV